jgi:hypothetical protein
VLLPAPGEMVMIEQDFHENGSIEPLATNTTVQPINEIKRLPA